MKRTSLALLTAVALTPAAQAAFVPITCVIDQPGQINALINTDGEITAVTKLKRDPTKEIYPSRYRNDESSQERYGTATATFTVNMQADNCGFDSNYVVTLKSTNDSKPWQQFQISNDNDRSKVLSANFDDGVYQPVPVVLSEGKQPGDALPTPQAFEYSGSRFAPIFSIDTLLRQLDSEYASYAEQQGWFETKPGSYHQRLWVNKHCISMRTEIHGYIG